MPRNDLDGYVPDNARAALLLVDVVNSLDFEDGELLIEPAMAMAEEIQQLKQACRAAGIPTIYANDNFGRWQSNFGQLVDRYLDSGCRGAPVIERLLPQQDDYNILKPKHSAFYATPMNLLLEHLGVEDLIIAGLTTDRCVSFTAHDAYMRDYRLLVPSDCAAAIEITDHQATLETMARVLKADIRPWRDLDIESLANRS